MKLTLKQIRAGFTNAYEVKVTLHVAHQRESDAVGYVHTMIEDWGANGAVIPSYTIDSCAESPMRFTNPKVRQVIHGNEGETDDRDNND